MLWCVLRGVENLHWERKTYSQQDPIIMSFFLGVMFKQLLRSEISIFR